MSFVGELGWELHCATRDGPKVYQVLHRVAQKSDIPLRNAGYRAFDSLSAEAGIFNYRLAPPVEM